MALSVGSLFSGIGGIDRGLERAGMVTRWFVEIERFAREVLAKEYPGRPIYGDIREIDWSEVEPVDLIAGGFPCQPISTAGQRRVQADDRWLWPEFARAVRALRPRYVLVENVAALLWPWRDKDGCGLWHPAPIEEVTADLAALGYVGEWDCLPAYTVGAPHERDRVWIVAHADEIEPERRRAPDLLAGAAAGREDDGPQRQRDGDASWHRRSVAHPPDEGCRHGGGRGIDGAGPARAVADGRYPLADAAEPRPAWSIARSERAGLAAPGAGGVRPAEPRMVRAVDGVPAWLDGHRWPAPPGPQHPWEPPRTVERDAIANRARRVGALGNAVVPPLVEGIGRAIVEFDEGR